MKVYWVHFGTSLGHTTGKSQRSPLVVGRIRPGILRIPATGPPFREIDLEGTSSTMDYLKGFQTVTLMDFLKETASEKCLGTSMGQTLVTRTDLRMG